MHGLVELEDHRASREDFSGLEWEDEFDIHSGKMIEVPMKPGKLFFSLHLDGHKSVFV
jgi:hypothetical protein